MSIYWYQSKRISELQCQSTLVAFHFSRVWLHMMMSPNWYIRSYFRIIRRQYSSRYCLKFRYRIHKRHNGTRFPLKCIDLCLCSGIIFHSVDARKYILHQGMCSFIMLRYFKKYKKNKVILSSFSKMWIKSLGLHLPMILMFLFSSNKRFSTFKSLQ